jgi:hypothetical protein
MDFIYQKPRKALILLAFLISTGFVQNSKNKIPSDKNSSLCGKTPIKIRFPQEFVEKAKNDDFGKNSI